MLLFYSEAMFQEPQTNSAETEEERDQQPRQYSSYPPRDPRRQRIVLPFDPRPVDLGTWTYEHKVGLCVVIIAYLLFGIVFLSTKLVVGVTPPEQHTIYLDMVPTPEEEQKPEEREMTDAELNSARNAISNEDALEEADRQNERTAGTGSEGIRRSSDGGPIPDEIADEADAVAARMRASKAAYEKGLREQQDMIDRHNANKQKQTEQGKKQQDVRVKGNVLITFSLAGRTFTYMHVPAYQCEGSGQVVVAITVNRNGKVTSANIKSSSSQEDCLTDRAIEAARLSRFNLDASAPASQSGTITYLFQRQ